MPGGARPGMPSGFTLLEMLVAIAVLGLLTVSVARGVSIGSFSLARARAAAAAANDLRTSDQMVRDLIAAASPAFASENLLDRRIVFGGTEDSLTLVTRRPASLGTPVPILARIFVAPDAHALMLAWRLDLPPSDGGGTLPEAYVLISHNVAAVRFSYLGDAGWQRTWTGATALPRKIGIEIETDGAAAQTPLVIEPRSDASAACTYDPTDIACARSP
jgi:prepilin-type N-terminal cleavage/methylation domain-containing protein